MTSATAVSICQPGMFADVHLVDGLSQFMVQVVPGSQRPKRDLEVPANPATPPTVEQLEQLARSGSWRALSVTSKQAIISSGSSSTTVIRRVYELWVYRIVALIQLGLFAGAGAELARLSVNSTAVDDEKPFELYLLYAGLPSHQGNLETSADRYTALLAECQMRLQRLESASSSASCEEEVALWNRRADNILALIVSLAVTMADYRLAIKFMNKLRTRHASNPSVLSSLARLYMFAGSMTEAEQLFQQVEQLYSKQSASQSRPSSPAPPSSPASPNQPAQLSDIQLMNRVLHSMATNRWEAARSASKTLQQRYPDDHTIANNSALCDVYLGRVQAAVHGLRAAMSSSPSMAGTAVPLVQNLCVLLDVSRHGRALASSKTSVVIEVGKWAGDGFNPVHFQMSAAASSAAESSAVLAPVAIEDS